MIIDISTDGSVLSNPGPGGWAALFRYEEYCKAIYGFEPDQTTNNRMELIAAIKALEHLSRGCSIKLHCDSEYVVNGITKWIHNWKKNGFKTKPFGKYQSKDVINRDLWERLDQATKRHTIQWIWVRGHDSHKDNNYCDELARRAALGKLQGTIEISRPIQTERGIEITNEVD